VPTSQFPTAPTTGFDQHTIPVGDFVGGGGSSGSGTLGPGGTTAPTAGGGMSTTPEPGTLALLGTGLLAIAGIMRRRRV
jgi:hypothetical protein